MALMPIDQLLAADSADDEFSAILDIATSLGLPVESWEDGGIGVTMLRVIAQSNANGDTFRTQIARAGFLDLAASITPEGGPGWLDLLAQSGYSVTREPSTFASTTNYVLTKSTPGSLVLNPGDLHVASTGAGAPTYTNTTGGTLAGSGGTLTVSIQADVAGSSGSAAPGQVTTIVSAFPGVTGTNAVSLVGTDPESNASVVDRCRSKLGSLSPDGPEGAYDYFARTIPLPAGQGGKAVTSGHLTTPHSPVNRTRVVQDLTNGHVTTYVANEAGPYVAPNAYTGSQYKTISATSNATPVVVSVAAHGYSSGDQIAIDGTGIPSLDGKTWTVTPILPGTFSLNGSTAPGTTSATGTAYRESDLDLIDKSIQANAVPNANTGITLNATAHTVAVTYQVWVPTSAGLTAAQIQSAVGTALTNYFAALPIGGANAAVPDQVFVNAIIGLIFATVPQATNVIVTSPGSDVTVGVNEVPTLGTVTGTVTFT